MTGTNGQGNKQVGFVVNEETWDRAMLISKDPHRKDAVALSAFLRTAVDAYLEKYERPEDTETPAKEQATVQSGRRRKATEDEAATAAA